MECGALSEGAEEALSEEVKAALKKYVGQCGVDDIKYIPFAGKVLREYVTERDIRCAEQVLKEYYNIVSAKKALIESAESLRNCERHSRTKRELRRYRGECYIIHAIRVLGECMECGKCMEGGALSEGAKEALREEAKAELEEYVAECGGRFAEQVLKEYCIEFARTVLEEHEREYSMSFAETESREYYITLAEQALREHDEKVVIRSEKTELRKRYIISLRQALSECNIISAKEASRECMEGGALSESELKLKEAELKLKEELRKYYIKRAKEASEECMEGGALSEAKEALRGYRGRIAPDIRKQS